MEKAESKNKVYLFFSFLWRNTLLKLIRKMKEKKKKKFWEETRMCRGRDNADKTFYVIRRSDLYCGLFSFIITSLARIDEAIKRNMIPIVDMQNSFNIYLDENKIGKENAWEYYFEQPMDYGLEDIKKSKNIVLSNGRVPDMFPYLDIEFLLGYSGEIDYWRKVAGKYIKVNSRIKEKAENLYHTLFEKDERVLGVLSRGTDYIFSKPKGHPVQPDKEQILNKAEEIFLEKNCDKIFLATEDESYYKLFKEKFGKKLYTINQKFLNYQGGAYGKEKYLSIDDKYKSGESYLLTILLLSKADCLCAGCTSATVGALLLTQGYEYTYLFDLGIY